MENTVRIIEQNYRKNKYVKYKNIYVTSVNWIFCSNIHNFFCILCHWTFQRMWNVTKTKHAVRTSLLWLSETFKIFRHKTTSLIKNILWWWHVNKKYLWLPAWDRGGHRLMKMSNNDKKKHWWFKLKPTTMLFSLLWLFKNIWIIRSFCFFSGGENCSSESITLSQMQKQRGRK